MVAVGPWIEASARCSARSSKAGSILTHRGADLHPSCVREQHLNCPLRIGTVGPTPKEPHREYHFARSLTQPSSRPPPTPTTPQHHATVATEHDQTLQTGRVSEPKRSA
ncbi:hypothetical protein SVAN01_05658 [Stagonosporopsis vannaccii]|nr:hypothetical protein SVAN01_05658 [Stagonosporopsis vannaccii]